MSAAVVAFFNNKGGVGKTSLVYHLACMYADLGRRVLAADLDPQANLTAAFLGEAALERIWRRTSMPSPTVRGMLAPLVEGTGDIAPVPGQAVGSNLFLLPGDLELSGFEDELSQAWPRCLEGAGNPRAFRVMSALGRLLRSVAALHSAEIVVVDVGPNLGVINRAALVASDHVVVPLAPDLFSVQGLRNLGPALRSWRDGWAARLALAPASVLDLPEGRMQPLGYVLCQPSSRQDRPTKAHQKWISRVPGVYAAEVLGLAGRAPADVANDSRCLAQVPHYRSLMPMAQEARRPVFALRGSDGAIGSHAHTTQKAYRDFSTLAIKIARRMSAADEAAHPASEASIASSASPASLASPASPVPPASPAPPAPQASPPVRAASPRLGAAPADRPRTAPGPQAVPPTAFPPSDSVAAAWLGPHGTPAPDLPGNGALANGAPTLEGAHANGVPAGVAPSWPHLRDGMPRRPERHGFFDPAGPDD